MPVKKVNFQEAFDNLVKEVEAIDADEGMSRSEKTKRLERAATKFKNALHDSLKKFRDPSNPKDHRPARPVLGTFNRYLTRARQLITRLNWKHHFLEDQIQKLSKLYPEIAARLQRWPDMSTEEMRLDHRDLKREIKAKLGEKAASDDPMYTAICHMKLDHQIMLYLKKTKAQKDAFAHMQEQVLEAKKTELARIMVNYSEFIQLLVDLLTRKTEGGPTGMRFAFNRLALGIAGATGRRAIEVLVQGHFEKASATELFFSGLAKQRGGADYEDVRRIYSLVDADLVLTAIKELRALPEVQALKQFDYLTEADRNTKINQRTAGNLNRAATALLSPLVHVHIGPDDTEADIQRKHHRVFKDSRMIYGRICYDLYWVPRKDPRWKTVDPDAFWKQILGHERMETQQNYKQFEIDYSTAATMTKAPTKTRAEAMPELDAWVEAAERDVLTKIHNWVKARLEEDPVAVIRKTHIIRGTKSWRPAIDEYWAKAEPILNLPAISTAGAVHLPKLPKALLPAAPLVASEDKPHVAAVEVRPGEWEATVSIDGRVVVRLPVNGGNKMEAMRAAYAQFKQK